MKKNMAAFILLLIMTLAANFLYADDTSFRCGNDLILNGYTMYQIRESCGAPDSEQVIGHKELKEQRGISKTDTTVYIIEWIYKRDFGIYILTFEGSKLVKKEFRRLN